MKLILFAEVSSTAHADTLYGLRRRGFALVRAEDQENASDGMLQVDDLVNPDRIAARAAHWETRMYKGWRSLSRRFSRGLRAEVDGLRLMTARSYARLEEFVARYRPWAVVVGSDQFLSRVAVECARREGIPTIYLPHGTLTNQPPYGAIHVDWTAEHGVFSRRWHTQGRYVDGIQVLTGTPPWDSLRPCARRVRPSDPRILLALYPPYSECLASLARTPSQARGVWRTLLRFTGKMTPRPRLLLKPHPSVAHPATRNYYEYEARRFGHPTVQWLTCPLRDALPRADIVISSYSNLVYEAVLMGRPTVVLPPLTAPMKALSSIVRIARIGDLGPAIHNLLTHPPSLELFRRDAALLHAGGDGRSARRIADLIARVAEKEGTMRREGSDGGG